MASARGSTVAMVAGGVLLALTGGCFSSKVVRVALPDRHTLVRDQLVLHSEFPLASHHRLLEDLTARRYDVSQRLHLPVSNEPIHVYLFERAEPFEAFMRQHHPDLPKRRAFFLKTDTRLIVYSQWGDRVAEDLRHEVTHGYLHAVVPNLPLWLDEGLAEYFETPRGFHGLNRPHAELLARRGGDGSWQADLVRLEQLRPDQEMTQVDYAEAWAWVHLLLESHVARDGLIGSYLAELKRHGTAEPISSRLDRAIERPEDALVSHVLRYGGASEVTYRIPPLRLEADHYVLVPQQVGEEPTG